MRCTIAVIGSGPSGCYLAQALNRRIPHADIAVFERLPVPYGLLRYGVAPDHQGTKSVIEQFDKMFARGEVKFAGGVEVGTDISLQRLRDLFDVVVIASGMTSDRRLGIHGDDSLGVYGAGQVTRLINSHPDEDVHGVDLGRSALIVGNGNVAIDVLRLLIKPEGGFINSDIDDSIHRHLVRGIRDVSVVGRSAAGRAKFDKTLIRELGRVPGVRYRVHDLGEPISTEDVNAQEKVEALRALEDVAPVGVHRVNVNFHFGWRPVRIDADSHVDFMTFVGGHDGSAPLVIETDSVITAIGFTHGERDTLQRRDVVNESTDDGGLRLGPGLYCSGWFGKGARGTIPEHRAESRALAAIIAADIDGLAERSPKLGMAALPADLRAKVIDFDCWKEIDRVEVTNAPQGRYRQKVRTRGEMLAIAGKRGILVPEERVS